MKTKLSLALALILVCSVALAQHQPAPKPAPPPMDPQMAAMMEAMTKAGTPGDAHKKLDGFTGVWNAKVTSWPAPGAKPMVMEGTAETKWIMDGRYIEQRFTSTFMGMPYEGLGYTGYDNIKKQYWSTWMDNMSTSMMTSTGKVEGNSWTYTGMMPDPMSGKDMRADTKVIINDAHHHTMEMWGPGPDGKMFKMMEIAYSREL